MSEGAKIIPSAIEEVHDKEKKELEQPQLMKKNSTATTTSVISEKTKVEEHVLAYDKRHWWTRVPFVNSNVPPPPKDVDNSGMIPEVSASWWSLLTFNWISSLLALGYVRPLEPSDLYILQDKRSSALIADKIINAYEARAAKAAEYNARLERGEISPGLKRVWWTLKGKREEREKEWREKTGRKKASLTMALNASVWWWFWSGGILKVIADSAQVTSPLLVKAIINFSRDSYFRHKLDLSGIPPVGRGIGLAFGLLLLQLLASGCTHHFFYRGASTGVLLRGGLITAIYRRSLRLTSRARSTLTNGKLVNHISTDVSRIDFCCGFFHMSWSAPIQLLICLGLLIDNIGPSALAGFGLMVLVTPVQTQVMKRLFAIRKKSMTWTDKRAKLLQELLGGMKIIKFFAWETPFLKRIGEYRKNEIHYIRNLLLIRAANNAVALSLPALAAVLSFVTYSLAGHDLDPAVIFASLTLFNLLRLPLMFLPMSFSAIADAHNAITRISAVFEAELLTDTKTISTDLDVALRVEGASFSWDAPPPDDAKKPQAKKGGLASKFGLGGKKAGGKKSPSASGAATPVVPPAEGSGAGQQAKADNIFQLTDIDMVVPRGQLVAIVGPVGTGKTSLLEGLIGEMRRTAGSVAFGGSVGYCPQSAWIQNATIRENVCFGRPFEEERYWDAVKRSCLEPDLDMLPHGDLTEVGEKGISLSGGQKQRLNICRAIYCDADIQIYDDPLSALDAHVGKAVFNNVLLNPAPGKTRILVTHALHFLPQVDYIYTMVNGRIIERGTYAELIAHGAEFSRFVKEFGNEQQVEEKKEEEVEEIEEGEKEKKDKEKRKKAAPGKALMQAEERATGSVSGSVYGTYIRAGNGAVLVPLLILSLVLIQGTTVLSSYWLVWWQDSHWDQSQGFYMGIYAGLGVGQAATFFIMGCIFAMFTYSASKNMHEAAIKRVMHAPMSFFETTPLGRIMNRFAKDIDTIDNMLGDALRMFANTFSNIIGAIILISILLPWFLIPVVAISLLYYFYAVFYRASARELKRLDAILRSSLYSHFSESLSGLATIRAYGEVDRFEKDNVERVNVENRAYWLTVTNQRWLGIRLDFLGTLLTFAVSLLVVGTRFSISPAQTGVVLSYIISVQQAFGWMVRQSAEVENDMNSVERIAHYANVIEQEAAYEVPEKKPPADWPLHGRVQIKDMHMRYRPELPPVIKGISMDIRGGEKIGIVGRTGAGKSTIMTALYRLVEISSGTIEIDGIDISKIGLRDLRSRLAIIPQDPLLFSGTLRSNLDPFGEHDDVRLWDALKRSYLVEDATSKSNSLDLSSQEASGGRGNAPRFNLDSPVDDEGGNLSIGQRSLVSLARALVKNSKILILDEATASVDYETDRKIQDTIAHEFSDRTILCIAHRLRTIIGYDRICVLDAGQIAEFDTPANLFGQRSSIFRSMCDKSSISADDIAAAARTTITVDERGNYVRS